MVKVKAYTISTCPHCKQTKKLLKDLGVEYEYIDVDLLIGEKRRQVLEAVRKINPAMSFPTIIIGDIVIVGHRESEIREALGK